MGEKVAAAISQKVKGLDIPVRFLILQVIIVTLITLIVVL
jgi:hypothetical protein